MRYKNGSDLGLERILLVAVLSIKWTLLWGVIVDDCVVSQHVPVWVAKI